LQLAVNKDHSLSELFREMAEPEEYGKNFKACGGHCLLSLLYSAMDWLSISELFAVDCVADVLAASFAA
jgi:hypothetical protein